MIYLYLIKLKLKEWDLVIDMEEKLLENRIIFINGEINEELANRVVSSLLYLDSISNEDISLYINSPGGIVTQGFAIIDTMFNIHDIRKFTYDIMQNIPDIKRYTYDIRQNNQQNKQ